MLLGMSELSHPRNLIQQSILVPPICIRPSVEGSPGMINEDDLTTKLREILKLNAFIKKSIEENVPLDKIFKQWSFLQANYY